MYQSFCSLKNICSILKNSFLAPPFFWEIEMHYIKESIRLKKDWVIVLAFEVAIVFFSTVLALAIA